MGVFRFGVLTTEAADAQRSRLRQDSWFQGTVLVGPASAISALTVTSDELLAFKARFSKPSLTVLLQSAPQLLADRDFDYP